MPEQIIPANKILPAYEAGHPAASANGISIISPSPESPGRKAEIRGGLIGEESNMFPNSLVSQAQISANKNNGNNKIKEEADEEPWEEKVKDMNISELLDTLNTTDEEACFYVLEELGTEKRAAEAKNNNMLDRVIIVITNGILLKRNEETNKYVHDETVRSEALSALGVIIPHFRYGLTGGSKYLQKQAIDFFDNEIFYLLLIVQEKQEKEDVNVAASEALQKICAKLIPDIVNLTKSKNLEIQNKAKFLLKKIADVFKKMMSSKNDEIRKNVNRTLAKMGHYIADDLETALNSHDPIVRDSAAVIIIYMGKEAKNLTDSLIIRLKDPDANVREHAVWALVKIGQEAIPAISDAVKLREPLVRANAISALDKMSKQYYADEARNEVITILRWAVLNLDGEELRDAKQAAVRAMGAWGKKAGREGFIVLILVYEDRNMCNSDSDTELLSAAARAMYKIDPVKAINYLNGPNALKRPGNPICRRVAASALGEMCVLALSGKGPAEGKGYICLTASNLINSVENDKDPVTRSICIRSLGNIVSTAGEGFQLIKKSIIEALIKKLEDKDFKNEDFNVRKEMVEAFGKIGKRAKAAAPKLKALKKKPYSFLSAEVRSRINQLNEAIDEALEKMGEK